MIELKNISKTYGKKQAVSDVSLTMEEGHIYGFLGSNGAGKSTIMNIMTGFIAASSGDVTINGYDIYKNAIKAKALIGYLPEIPPLYPDMTVYEYLVFVSDLKGIKRAERDSEIDRVAALATLDDVGDRLIKNLSKGYKQRVGLAQALLGNPPIIILDEPTVGLDPVQIIEIRNIINSLKKDHTVILSSHILSEIEEVCDHVFIIADGVIKADDDLATLTSDGIISLEDVFLETVGVSAEYLEKEA